MNEKTKRFDYVYNKIQKRRNERIQKINKSIMGREKQAQSGARKIHASRSILNFFTGKKTKGMSLLSRGRSGFFE